MAAIERGRVHYNLIVQLLFQAVLIVSVVMSGEGVARRVDCMIGSCIFGKQVGSLLFDGVFDEGEVGFEWI